ncbi:MAG: hypothetical protein ACJAYU_000217 [Bradymonadia bacterium]|jgi:hypothetical protein
MPRERLIQLLDEVQEELDAVDDSELDAETATKLREVGGDIREWLDNDEDKREPKTFQDRLGLFEAQHPTLTQIVASVADTLGKMGI